LRSPEKEGSGRARRVFSRSYFAAEEGKPAKRVRVCGRDREPNRPEWIDVEAFRVTCATLQEPARSRLVLRDDWLARKESSALLRMRECGIARRRVPLWRVPGHRSCICGLSVHWSMKTRRWPMVRRLAQRPEAHWPEMVRGFPSVDRPLFSRRYASRQI